MVLSGVYAIVDVTTLDRMGLDAVAFGRALLTAPLAALQLRAKDVSGARMSSLARELGALSRAASVPFFVNDRVDVALLVGAGVHLGQSDISPRDARELAERAGRPLTIGFSTHDEAQAAAALEMPIDYLALGPVFETTSKQRPDPVLGAERACRIADAIRARRSALPLVAIGGIGPSRFAELARGFDAVALIGALLPKASSNPAERAVALSSAFAGAGA